MFYCAKSVWTKIAFANRIKFMKKYLILVILMSVFSLNTAYASESFNFEAEVENEIVYLSFESSETKPVFNIWIMSCSDKGLQFETSKGTRVDCSGGNGRMGNFEGSGELKLIPKNLKEDTDVTFYVSYSSNTSGGSDYEVRGTSRSAYKSVTINMEDDDAEEPVFCTADAMQCSDGSWVSRTGSNCEFICPKVKQEILDEPVNYEHNDYKNKISEESVDQPTEETKSKNLFIMFWDWLTNLF
jgi:hypothetical protein